MQALHIFEPRYRQMTADALVGDRLLAMALLQPGWEGDYGGRPALYPVVCLGRIVADERLPDGRYNLQLRGLCRARILEEIETGKPYRSARVALVEDKGQPLLHTDRDIRQEFLKIVPPWWPRHDSAMKMFHKLLQGALPIGLVCDVISFGLPLPVEFKQSLLEQSDVQERIFMLLSYLRKHPPPEMIGQPRDKNFPPDFSAN